MKLRDWLDRENLTFTEMGSRIGRTGEAVRRYVLGERIPDRDTMPKIVSETSGEVTANDFFDIGHLLSDDNQPSPPNASSDADVTSIGGHA